ncbi:formylmethanofuran dehydrogenase subunit B [Candidatus Geothermarchaeota archaeon ex4572_27]|nr:MAG: formylmethanofuran dehydrogenase subunit B [Candidatus Geothermarchaeota archaeon ex4572_27]
MDPITVTLITGRTMDQGRAMEEGKFLAGYVDKCAVIELDPDDLSKLGVQPGSNVKVRTDYGEVVVKAVASPSPHPGVAFIPMGPWANAVVNPNTYGSGMPTLKGVKALVEPTTEPVKQLPELLSTMTTKPVEVKVGGGSEAKGDPPSSAEYTVSDVVCPFCGCTCDDIQVTVRGGSIASVKGPCALGTSKFMNYNKERAYKPMVRRDGRFVEVSYDEAIEEAARILANAKYPVLYGWSSTSNEAMRLGVELAELVGGVVDNTAVICHGPTILGTQQVGVVTATLGQIKNRADLIVYWGCNPLFAHPRHTVRYSAMAKGKYVPEGRRSRKVIVVDVRPTPTSKIADLFVKVEPGMDYELLTALRMAVRGHTIEASEVAGVPRETIEKMADMLMSARFGVIFFGMGLTMTQGKGRNVEEAIKLVQDLNEWTKFVLLAMRGHFNVTGTNAVMAWLTGYPYAVEFSRGFPRSNPGVTSSTDILMRGEADAALIVASDPASHFPRKAVEHLAKIPTIVIDPRWTPTAAIADVFIPTTFVGIEAEGTIYRMDKVPLRAKKVVDPPPGLLSDVEVLERLIARVRELKAAR